MLPEKIAFVDTETTGMRSQYDRIIEIGILRVEKNVLVKQYHSLLNPQTHLPPEITMLTGINAADLESAPTFRQVKEEIHDILSDCLFVAHNVRFDYGFVKSEFKREMITFSSKHFCTVRLSRLLYPDWSYHNLDSLINHLGLSCKTRHRAFDDAAALFHFYQKILVDFPPEQLENAVNRCMKKPSLPVKLKIEDLESLPEKPGVYIFYGSVPYASNVSCVAKSTKEKGSLPLDTSDTPDTLDTLQPAPLYVGKSINIRDRVLSHFSSDLHSGIEMKISQQVEHIETITTAGELGALLLESQLIKSLLPLYNRKSRIKRELVAIKSRKTASGYQEAFLEPITKVAYSPIIDRNQETSTPENDYGENNKKQDAHDAYDNSDTLQSFLGFFKSRKQAKNFLIEVCHKYELCEKYLGLEKTATACFGYRLGRCKGACVHRESPLQYNLRFITAFADSKIRPWPFRNPILIEEEEMNEKKEYFLIDNWCYLGNITIDNEGNKKHSPLKDAVFDIDVYNILRQHLKNPNNIRKIRSVNKFLLSEIVGNSTGQY